MAYGSENNGTEASWRTVSLFGADSIRGTKGKPNSFLMHELSIVLPEFQGDAIVKHYAWWTVREPFQKIGQPRANWV